ncbi:hypothetical protein CRUP_010856 [Coryphaenoides rupestris]|nr:hypothetical protein CRUP_010856 [Coryphaenoides rupestris]
MIQLEKPPAATGTMPVVWPTILDLGRDECKRILRKLELEAYAGVISALRAQGDLNKDKKDLLGELTKILSISTERHRAEVRRAVNDERLTTIAYHMSGPNSASEWSIEGRRLVPLMPRLVPQTAFTVTANAVANATANQNASLLLPAETGNKEGVSCSDEDEKPRKRRRTNSSSGATPVVLKEVAKVSAPSISKGGVGLPMASPMVSVSGSSPKMSNIMQSIANFPAAGHLSPVKGSLHQPHHPERQPAAPRRSSNFVPNILSKSHSHGNSASSAALSKLVSTSMLTAASHKQTVVFPAAAANNPNTVAVTAMVSSSPSVVMSTIAQCSAGVKVASARLPSPKTMAGSPTQILAHSSSPIMVVSSNGAIMSTKLVSQPTATQTTYTRPTVSPNISARISAAAAAAGATYVKTTSGSIITVVPKSLATLGGKIISSNIVSGTTTKITTIPMTSKPNVIVVQKTTGKGATIQGLPGKNGEKSLQAVQGAKPAIITTSRPITKMIVTQPKGMSSGVQATATKIIPTKIVYGQQGKTQVLIKPKPVFQAAVVSEQTRQLVSETLQQVSRSSAEAGQSQPTTAGGPDGGAPRDETTATTGFPDEAAHSSSGGSQDSQPVVHLVTTREQDWVEQEVESSPTTTTTIIYQDMSLGESQHPSSGPASTAPAPAPTPAPAAPAPPPPQLQSRPQVSQPSSSSSAPSSSSSASSSTSSPVASLGAATLVKKLVRQPLPKPPVALTPVPTLTPTPTPPPPTLTQSPKERPVIAAGQPVPKSLGPVTTTTATAPAVAITAAPKPPVTPQLPRLQQAPTTTHHRPIHAPLSQPPPLQAHHPVGAEKSSSSSGQQQPIITQNATVTKITFGGSHHSSSPHFGAARGDPGLAAVASAAAAEPGSSKTSVSDILKISMMEAEIDPSVEPMVVDSSSDRKALSDHTGGGVGAGGLTVPTASDMLDAGQLISSTGPAAHLKAGRSGPFGRLQGMAGQRTKEEDMDVIEFSILPDSSQSNVVVEPSGFLEITNYTSQQLDHDCPMMEPEGDSSSSSSGNEDDRSPAGPP